MTQWFSDSTFWGGFLLSNRFLEQGSDEEFKTLQPMAEGQTHKGAPFNSPLLCFDPGR